MAGAFISGMNSNHDTGVNTTFPTVDRAGLAAVTGGSETATQQRDLTAAGEAAKKQIKDSSHYSPSQLDLLNTEVDHVVHRRGKKIAKGKLAGDT
jgi:hypothetical protein